VITLATNELIMMMRRRSLWSLVSLLCIMVCATPAAICQTGPQAESVSDPGEKLAPDPSTALDSTDLLLPAAAAAF
jgi:ABC-type oligopeptide transport system substrate-binding subunit